MALIYTEGFAPDKRYDHFEIHLDEFDPPPQDEFDYEEMADGFLGGTCDGIAVRECVRESNRDVLRYNVVTDEFGILCQCGIIVTYCIPNPRIHGYPTNMDYYIAECNRNESRRECGTREHRLVKP